MISDATAEAKRAIHQLVDDWIIFSDSGQWDAFARCWHDDGFMSATWFQASAAEFIKARKEGFDRGVSIIHFNGAHTSEVNERRAVSQTKMTISQRAPVHDVSVDVVCTGRFYDFFEQRDGRWGLVRRQPIYEKDRMDPVDPAASLTLDHKLLADFPVGYQHLAYLQSQIGYRVKRSGMPGLKGPEIDQLYSEGQAWLDGAATSGKPQ